MPPSTRLLSVLVSLVVAGLLGGFVGCVYWLVFRREERRPVLPQRPARVAPWGWQSMALVLLTFMIVSPIFQGGYLVVRGTFGWRVGPAPARTQGVNPADDKTPQEGESSLFSSTERIFLTAGTFGLLLPAIPWVLRRSSGCRLADLGLTTEGWFTGVRAGVLAFFLVVPVVYATFAVALLVYNPDPQELEARRHDIEKMVRNEAGVPGVILAVLSAVIVAPAAEELIFRGVLQSWLGRVFRQLGSKSESLSEQGIELTDGEVPSATAVPNPRDERRADRFALVTSSFLFALMHFPQMPAPVAIFVLALALGYLYQRTGSLVASITLHAMFNGMSMLALLANPG
jgi:membrane protease YdiL (CAAX protease family)